MKEVLQAHFLPEFLNRIDETIIFHTLGRKEVRRIVELQIVHLKKQLEQNGLSLEISDAALTAIADQGYDPVFGARPLKRVIQQIILDPLALKLVAGDIKDSSTVTIGAKGESITIQ